MANSNSGQGKMFKSPGSGRKRSQQDYNPSGGDRDDGYSKRGRYDEVGGGGGDAVPPATLRVLVRNQDAGGIIGKGGENIKHLRKKHDCQVVLPDAPGAPERVMTMMGSIEGCVGVLSDCLPKLGEGGFREKGGGQQRQHRDENVHEVQVLIPQPFMGTIIGTGGTKIKELRTRTRTNVKIFSDPMPNSNERSVQIVGSEAQVTDCVHYFLEEISKKDPREPIYLYEPGQMYDLPPPGDFGISRGRGAPFRGMPFRGGGGGRGGRSGGDRESFTEDDWSPRGGGGGDLGNSGRAPRGPSFSGGWHSNQRDRDRRGMDSQPPLVPTPSGAHQSVSRPPLIDPGPQEQTRPPAMFGVSPPNLAPPSGPHSLIPPSSQPASLLQQTPPTQFHSPSHSLGQQSSKNSQPPLMGGGYNPPPPQPLPAAVGGYGAAQSGGYSNQSHPHTAIPTPIQNAQPPPLGQAGALPPPMYLPPSAPPSLPPSAPQGLPPNQPPSGGQITQQVTIPSEYTMSILGHNGARLNQIKSQSSCDVMIDDPKPGSTERVITITGLPSNIQFAQMLMQNSVRQYHSV